MKDFLQEFPIWRPNVSMIGYDGELHHPNHEDAEEARPREQQAESGQAGEPSTPSDPRFAITLGFYLPVILMSPARLGFVPHLPAGQHL